MNHLDHDRLLEAIYLPEESRPTLDHLAACELCAHRLAVLRETLEDDVARLGDRISGRPESFWSRQSIAVARKIESQSSRQRSLHLPAYALAATIALALLASGMLYRIAVDEPEPVPQTRIVQTESPVTETPILEPRLFEDEVDPWASDELEDFRQVVSWESWIDESELELGGTS